jgi:hypothetical protein
VESHAKCLESKFKKGRILRKKDTDVILESKINKGVTNVCQCVNIMYRFPNQNFDRITLLPYTFISRAHFIFIDIITLTALCVKSNSDRPLNGNNEMVYKTPTELPTTPRFKSSARHET